MDEIEDSAGSAGYDLHATGLKGTDVLTKGLATDAALDLDAHKVSQSLDHPLCLFGKLSGRT